MTATTTATIIQDPEVEDALITLLSARAGKSALTKAEKDAKNHLQLLMGRYRDEFPDSLHFTFGLLQVTFTPRSGADKIQRHLLLEKGVMPDVIDACTIQSPGFEVVKVTKAE